MTQPLFFSIKQTSLLLGVSRQTLNDWRTTNPDFPLPLRKGVTEQGYYRHEIEAYLERRRQEAMQRYGRVAA